MGRQSILPGRYVLVGLIELRLCCYLARVHLCRWEDSHPGASRFWFMPVDYCYLSLQIWYCSTLATLNSVYELAHNPDCNFEVSCRPWFYNLELISNKACFGQRSLGSWCWRSPSTDLLFRPHGMFFFGSWGYHNSYTFTYCYWKHLITENMPSSWFIHLSEIHLLCEAAHLFRWDPDSKSLWSHHSLSRSRFVPSKEKHVLSWLDSFGFSKQSQYLAFDETPNEHLKFIVWWKYQRIYLNSAQILHIKVMSPFY